MDNQSTTKTSIDYSALDNYQSTIRYPFTVREVVLYGAGSFVLGLLLVWIGIDESIIISLIVAAGIGGLLRRISVQQNDIKKANAQLLDQFAQSNQFTVSYEPVVAIHRPGSIFISNLEGNDRNETNETSEIVSGEWGRFPFQVFKYSYVVGTGENSYYKRIRVGEFTLPHSLPHMVIDSLVEGLYSLESTLPEIFRNSQQLTLEGDFSKYFKVYALDGTGITALTLLAPDTMMVLLQKASQCDIEIVDNKLYFYWPECTDLKKSYQEMFSVTEAVLDKIGDKLQRADKALLSTMPSITLNEHVASHNVANQNLRLQRKSDLLPKIVPFVVTIPILFVIVPIIYGLANPGTSNKVIMIPIFIMFFVLIPLIFFAIIFYAVRRATTLYKLKQEIKDRYQK